MRRHLNKTYHPDWLSYSIYHLLFFPQAEILPQEGMFLISRISKWYWADFGGSREALLDRLLNFLFIPLLRRGGRALNHARFRTVTAPYVVHGVGVIEGH